MLIYRLWQFFLKIIVLIFHIFKNNRKILYHLWKILLNDRFQIQFLNPNPFRLLLFLILEYFTFYIYFFQRTASLSSGYGIGHWHVLPLSADQSHEKPPAAVWGVSNGFQTLIIISSKVWKTGIKIFLLNTVSNVNV